MLDATHPREVAANAFLKLCRLDVNAETERWARTPPRFSADGRVALITVASGFQSELGNAHKLVDYSVHPVIATRWAGTLGRKSSKLVMIICANTNFNPNSSLVSFSCRLSSPLRKLSDEVRRESPQFQPLICSQPNRNAPPVRRFDSWFHGTSR